MPVFSGRRILVFHNGKTFREARVIIGALRTRYIRLDKEKREKEKREKL
jgi:hypothetical protein